MGLCSGLILSSAGVSSQTAPRCFESHQESNRVTLKNSLLDSWAHMGAHLLRDYNQNTKGIDNGTGKGSGGGCKITPNALCFPFPQGIYWDFAVFLPQCQAGTGRGESVLCVGAALAHSCTQCV